MTSLAEHEATYREALAAGRLRFQRCPESHAWLPPRQHCPTCLADAAEWVEASGEAKLLSWVVYRRSFDPATEDRVPYNVAVVELAEGPRLITNLVGVGEGEELPADAPLRMRIEHEGDFALPRFEPLLGVGCRPRWGSTDPTAGKRRPRPR
jgi:uncharacterized OB-fold protein